MTFVRPARAPDWADTVSGTLRDPGRTAREVFFEALEETPLWLSAAMVVRTLVAMPLGLRTGLRGKGHFLTRMPVVADTLDHFETGLEDRHLTFTLATRVRDTELRVTTAIWFNGRMGRIYLTAVMPGHLLATRQIVNRVATQVFRKGGEYPWATAS